MCPKSRLTASLPAVTFLLTLSALAQDAGPGSPQVSYRDAAHSTLLLKVDGKEYIVNVSQGTVRPDQANAQPAADLFASHCVSCHGVGGKGLPAVGTRDFTDPQVQAGLSDQEINDSIRNGKSGRMPAWSGVLTDMQISDLAGYIRSFSAAGSTSNRIAAKQGIYQPGDDVLFSLPTGRPVDRHGVYVNFTHRFAYDPAFSGRDKGAELFGLDNFALSSLGVRYGVTDKLSVDVWRSPSFVGRPIQLMAAYNFLDEHHGAPVNLAMRVSIEGQDNFRKNFTENIEAIVSRSITSRAQFYVVPTVSFNDRPLVQGGLLSNQIPDLPGVNAFSIGFGAAVDIRPTVALLAEVIPTLANGEELGIHRPAFSFAIQKKILRHAFTLGLTTSPGTTVSERAATRATFLGDPSADTPAGLFIGFDLTRQIH
jgi:mono/diheme cytochrome c family protein